MKREGFKRWRKIRIELSRAVRTENFEFAITTRPSRSIGFTPKSASTIAAPRGMPVFRGLVGPMPEGKNVVRYESPDVFEALTKEWSTVRTTRRRRRATPEV